MAPTPMCTFHGSTQSRWKLYPIKTTHGKRLTTSFFDVHPTFARAGDGSCTCKCTSARAKDPRRAKPTSMQVANHRMAGDHWKDVCRASLYVDQA
mmetsp:Transcript_6710/g.14510  ORF Transcript_6710/g.14510 Transcript_6710/m.14510 type:complete len:95 (+) Transcript_6710:369-653(+)